MKLRDLTLRDVEDLLDMEGSRFDILVATAARAKHIHEIENQAETPPPPPKIRIKRSAAARTSSSSPSPSKKRKHSKSPKKNKNEQQYPPPPLPEEFKRAIADMARGRILTAPTLVIQKGLTATDLSSGQCRLSMPISQVNRDDFLTEEEKGNIRSHDGSRKRYVDAMLLESSAALMSKVKITQWDMPKSNGRTSSSYVINGTWKGIVKRNKLQVHMLLQVWSFRVDQELCFALVRVPRYVARDDDDDDVAGDDNDSA